MARVIFSLLVLSALFSSVSDASALTLFKDNFNSGDLSGWSTWATQGQAGMSSDIVKLKMANFNGNKVLDVAGSGIAIGYQVAALKYTIDVDMYVYDNSYSAYAAGLLFGAGTPSADIAGMDAYMFQERPYRSEIEKWTFGRGWNYLADSPLVIAPDTWNHLTVEVDNSHVQTYINGNKVFDTILSDTTGGVGFRSWIAGIYFDNFEVSAPDHGHQPVPEPSTIFLLGAGLLGLGFVRSTKKK